MKNTLILSAFLLLTGLPLANKAQAQTDNFEIGIRFDGVYRGYAAAVDAMMPLGENRLHGNLSFGGWGLGASVIYDWQNTFGNGVNGYGEWLWYPGFGVGIGIWDDGYIGNGNGGVGVSAIGEFGIEYQFDFPMSIGVDIRPSIGFGNYIGDGIGFYIGSGLNVRYRF